jgi:hypothetical protein
MFEDSKGVRLGCLLGLVLNIVAVGGMLVAGAAMGVAFIGVVQLLYLIPLAIVCRRRREPAMLKGIIIIGSITFLLSATCAVLLLGVKLTS